LENDGTKREQFFGERMARFPLVRGLANHLPPMNRLRCQCLLRSFLSALLFAGFAAHLLAHDVGLSTATVQLQTNRLEALLTFAVRETEEVVPLDVDQDGRVTADEFTLGRDKLSAALAANCLVSFDGALVKAEDVRCQLDSSNNVDVYLSFPNPQFKQLEMNFQTIRLLTPGHRMFFTLLNPAGETIAERLLSQNSCSVTIQLDAATPETAPRETPTFIGFVKLGIEHIGTGYDHLLFLFGLLIVTRSFRSSLVVITCFTLAHSITLAVATFNLVHLSPKLTEPLIAATILYVGVENLLQRGDPHGRWLLTFAFGLIHGFGFASVLRDMGVGAHAGGVAMPLFSFNLGVELGQLAVAAIVLPLVWKLRTKEVFLRRGVPACSMLVALAGAFWFVQRVWF
jgi:hypothetical protein